MAAGIDGVIRSVRHWSVLMRIVAVNVAAFVVLRLTAIVGIFSGAPGLIDSVMPWLELSAGPSMLLVKPWTLFSYMFTQWDLLHLVFNMLWLYWFATIFLTVSTPARLMWLYFLGGLGGALFFMTGGLLLPALGAGVSLVGSSASVIAIVTAVAILMPRFRMMLFLLGSVEIRWIALATILLVLIGVTGGNAGGELAHLGGITVGAVYALALRRGTDLLAPLLALPLRMKSLRLPRRQDSGSPSSGPRSRDEMPGSARASGGTGGLSPDERADLDRILDKIKKSGYASLTSAERDRLFSVSKNIK